MNKGADFISDLIDRTLANPFSGRFLTDRNLFVDGQNLLGIFIWSIKYHLKSGELQSFLGASGESYTGTDRLLVRVSSCTWEFITLSTFTDFKQQLFLSRNSGYLQINL